ncbi:MAG: hypothetical protein IT436_15090 [Phycisphaerales bacterium]|nr:hypothetical protein [Phycisphaerales bacterium]
MDLNVLSPDDRLGDIPPTDEPTAADGGFRRLPSVSARAADGAWHVAHTRPRQEKALGEALTALGIACFVPLVRHIRYYAHRKRIVDLPLFQSYAFLFGTRDHAHQAIRTKRIAHVLPVEDQARLEHELLQIDRAIAGHAAFDPYPFLAVGKRVAVTAGPFRGLEGLIDERRSPHRLVLNVSLLGRATSLEIDASLLEVID